jgi:hypothetical protein
MLDLVQNRETRWRDSLRPKGEGTFDQEPFSDWWKRHADDFRHLHPRIAEQWIYRHWRWAHFQFLDLTSLKWCKHSLSTAELLIQVHLEFGGPCDAEYDYGVFANPGGGGKTATARHWQDGSWTIPPVVLSTPEGIINHTGPLPEVRMILVEGSLRYRFLNALHDRGEAHGPHEFYLLETR